MVFKQSIHEAKVCKKCFYYVTGQKDIEGLPKVFLGYLSHLKDALGSVLEANWVTH